MSDGKMSMLFFEIGLVLTLISCVLGPCGIQDWSIACAVVAGFLSLGGIYLAFGSWDEEEELAKYSQSLEEKSAHHMEKKDPTEKSNG